MPKLIFSLAVIAAGAVLGGCASSPCRDTLSYRDARPHALPTVPTGLKPIAPDPDFQIPPGKVATTGPGTSQQCVALPPQVVKPGEPAEKTG